MSLRVLHAPTAGAGHAGRLAKAERALGLASVCVACEPNRYGFPVDELLHREGGCRLASARGRLRLLLRALRDFDVVHFNMGRSFVPSRWVAWDVPLLKGFGKAVFVTFQGDDARQGDVVRARYAVHFADRVEPGYYTAASDARKRRRIDTFRRHADGMFALNPDLVPLLGPRARFVPYASVEPAEWTPRYEGSGREVPVIVHAPTHRAVKGTDVLLDAVAQLRAEGLRFELVLVEGVTRTEARRIYEEADLCVDQLFAGWYGGLAVELMALGKPVMCYLREEDLDYIPALMRAELPLIRTTPATVADTLREWLGRPREDWRALGRRSRAYVERWHSPLAVAREMKRHYEAALGRGPR